VSAQLPAALKPPIVVDTDVLSYLFKGDTRAADYQLHLTGCQPIISFMTMAELEFWATQRSWGPRTCERLERFLTSFAIHYPDRALCGLWGSVMAAARRAGRPIGPMDAWVAATALLHGVSLVTNNVSDYAGVPGLALLTVARP
jgi:tRNA(fMet)-specific endonuclease VapC